MEIKINAKKAKLTPKQRLMIGLKRFARVIVPQLPGLILTFGGVVDVKYMPIFVCAGAIITSLDKVARDFGWYKIKAIKSTFIRS